jgi:hypothetical protein
LKQCHILVTELEHIEHPGRIAPTLPGVAVTESSKAISLSVTQWLQDDGENGKKISEFHEQGLIAALHLLHDKFTN